METNTLIQHDTPNSFPSRGNTTSSHPEPNTHKQKPYPPRTSDTHCKTNSSHTNSHMTPHIPRRKTENMRTTQLHYYHAKHAKTGRQCQSNTNIIALISIHSPDILFLTETPVAKDCSAICGIFSNRGYNSHYHPANSQLENCDTIPEARLPPSITHKGVGCMIGYKKKNPGPPPSAPSHFPKTYLDN